MRRSDAHTFHHSPVSLFCRGSGLEIECVFGRAAYTCEGIVSSALLRYHVRKKRRRMRYVAYDQFIEPARARAQLWRIPVGVVLMLLVTVLWSAGMFLLAYFMWGGSSPTWAEEFMTTPTPTSSLTMLLTILGLGAGTMLAAKWLHRRSAGSLFGPRARVIGDFGIAAGICFVALMGAQLVLMQIHEVERNLDLDIWLGFLPVTLVVLIFQTGSEELAFRGYLQQQLGARFRPVWVSILLPSLLFGLLHVEPGGDPAIGLMYFGVTGLFGLIAADLTRVTGSIGAAWGFHFANNVIASLFFGIKGDMLSGLALYTSSVDKTNVNALVTELIPGMAMILLLWFILRALFKRRQDRADPMADVFN